MVTVMEAREPRRRQRSIPTLGALLLLSLPGCYDFHETGPLSPDPVPFPTVVSIQVEYVQPNGCIATTVNCSDLVVFFGSWMRAGSEVQLSPSPDHHVWTGIVTGVPVNFPPSGSPYVVRIYDPFLQDEVVVRYTGRRLTVGGQLLEKIDQPGAHEEGALAYIDELGKAHNPY